MSNDNPFLSENFDFIEESTPFTIEPLEFQDIQHTDITESKSADKDFKIIGKVRGCMAPIGVYSRNHRIYEDSHWTKVLSNPALQERLATRSLYGMPSHMQKPIDDEDFREGRISHIVSCLEVRNDPNGKPFLYGEFDILDTPAGRILKAMYEGGAGIYVSTRAAGRLLPIPGDSVNKKVDSSSYWLGGIDCVLNPGFLQAKPAFETVEVVKTQPALCESKEETLESQAVAESQPISESELQVLQSQVSKLTKIIEKVVDDVYEPVEEEVQKQPIAEPKDTSDVGKTEEVEGETKIGDAKKQLTEENQAALVSALALISQLNVTDEALTEAIDIITDKIKE